jgi:hypothetical protein
MSGSALPIIGQFSALERCADAVATFVEQHPNLSNLELHALSRLLLGALVRETRPEIAAAMILAALLAVRDAPDALRGDDRTITDSRQTGRVS